MGKKKGTEKAKKSGARKLAVRLREGYGALAAHRYTTIAGTLAFFLVTSVVPFLFWLTLLFGDANVSQEVISELSLFDWAKDLLLFLSENAAGASSGASVFFLATTLWSSTGFFYHLRRSGEIIYDANRTGRGWKVRLSALLLTFALLLFFACAGAVLLAAMLLTSRLSRWFAYPLQYGVLFLVGFFAAWILNAYICPYRLSPAQSVLGSLLTAVLWLAAAALFAVYLRFSNSEKLYGALSLVIVFFLFLYYMMICFTVGAIFNRRKLKVRSLQPKAL